MDTKSEKANNQSEKDQANPAEAKNKEPLKIDENNMGGLKKNMGNDISSEIKIANADGELEGGDNKQWHMDQGSFNDQEKVDFENGEKK